MKNYLCRLTYDDGNKMDIVLVAATSLANLFWQLDEIADPYEFEILHVKRTTMTGCTFVKTDNPDPLFEGDDFYFVPDSIVDGIESIIMQPERFENKQLYCLHSEKYDEFTLKKIK